MELLSRVEDAEAEGRLELTGFCDHQVGIAWWFRGQTDRSIACHERAISKARSANNRVLEASILATLMLQDAIDRERAAASARAAIDISRASNHTIGVAMGLLSLAGSIIHDAPDEALPVIDELIDVARRSGARWYYAAGLRIKAHALSRAGRLEDASDVYADALELNGVGDFGELLWYTVLNILEHLQRIDRPETAAIALGKISAARGAPRDALVQRSMQRSRLTLDTRLGGHRGAEMEARGQATNLADFLKLLDHELRHTPPAPHDRSRAAH